MCELMKTADMPTKENDKENKKFIAWFPKPNEEGEYTRVRLLWFMSPNKNNRNTPYFTQVIHDHWGEITTKDGKTSKVVDDTIVCPLTKYSDYNDSKWIKNPKTGKNEVNCPICKREREAMAVWKNSSWKDKSAMKRHFSLQSRFRAIIPVYMIQDPNNPNNDKKMKVIVLTNKEDFELFDQVVKAEKAKAYLSAKNGKPYEIFNGTDGIDLYLHCETVEETKKNGFVQKVRKMTGIAFDDPSSKYDIHEITKDKIESDLPMDEQFYVSNTKEEIEEFYKKYYSKDETVVPRENVNLIFEKMKANQNLKKDDAPSVSNKNAGPDIANVPQMMESPNKTEDAHPFCEEDDSQPACDECDECTEHTEDGNADVTTEILSDLETMDGI